MENQLLHGQYKVYDCEHMGDMYAAETYLTSLGLNPTAKYWDRQDGGEAYIEFTCTVEKFKEVYPKIQRAATFKENILPYLPKGEGFDVGGKFKTVTLPAFRQINLQMDEDLSKGFEQRIPLSVFIYGFAGCFDSNQIMEDLINTFEDPKKVKPICCATNPTDSDPNYHYLISVPIEQITQEVMKTIGDTGYEHKNLFKTHHAYGHISCRHALMDRSKDYTAFRMNVQKQAALNNAEGQKTRRGRRR